MHTPGPWAWRGKSGSLHQVGTERPYGATVLAATYEYDSGVDTVVSDADAALIAAAPDLLAALKALLVEARYLTDQLAHRGLRGAPGDTVDRVMWAAAHAISKAEGAE